MLYVLSIGLGIWLFDHNVISSKTVVMVWKPVYLLEQNSYTRPIFEWYCAVWVRQKPSGGKWLP